MERKCEKKLKQTDEHNKVKVQRMDGETCGGQAENSRGKEGASVRKWKVGRLSFGQADDGQPNQSDFRPTFDRR